MKLISIVGARPEFVQSAPVSRVLRKHHTEILVHTGQHYDYRMSQAFFDDLGIPVPDYNLEVGSGLHGKQTGEILGRIEEVLLREKPDGVIVRGDTNSTLAGSLAASKLHIPTAHIESGERSFERSMPEEVNRLVADRLADLHFCVSHKAIEHLAAEGITSSAHWVGDVMLDASLQNRELARSRSTLLERLGLSSKAYALVTIHRSGTTDDPRKLQNVVDALNKVNETIVFPVHPRTRKMLDGIGACFLPHVRILEPVGYFDMMMLEENARMIATDSGGVQREAYFMGVPCITLRDETEWVETVEVGWNRLVGTDTDSIVAAWFGFQPEIIQPPIFGDGNASQKIVDIIESTF
jgi:UDP-GlcNAc3NAcA epimerase